MEINESHYWIVKYRNARGKWKEKKIERGYDCHLTRKLTSTEGMEIIVQLYDGNGNVVASESRVLMPLKDYQNKLQGQLNALEEYCIEAFNIPLSYRSSLEKRGYTIIYVDAKRAKERIRQEMQDEIATFEKRWAHFKMAVENEEGEQDEDGDFEFWIEEVFEENRCLRQLYWEYVCLIEEEKRSPGR